MSKTAVTKTLIALAARLLLPALLAWAPLAQAGQVTQTRDISSPGFLTLDEFDGSLGVLQSVSISFDASVSRTVRYTCTGTANCSFGNTVYLDLVSFSVGTISLVATDNGALSAPCLAGTNCILVATADIDGSDVADDAQTLALFTDTGSGPDTFDLQFIVQPSGELSFHADATVTYVYEDRAAVPEPSTLAGVALGLMALTATARRRGGSGRKG
jgi:hypothetical protein